MAKFKTRARAVDMLGRQQIADVSTAISELFKNAHDAYADHVEVDYFRSDNLLVIRDDGTGMTKDEFEVTIQHRARLAPSDRDEQQLLRQHKLGQFTLKQEAQCFGRTYALFSASG